MLFRSRCHRVGLPSKSAWIGWHAINILKQSLSNNRSSLIRGEDLTRAWRTSWIIAPARITGLDQLSVAEPPCLIQTKHTCHLWLAVPLGQTKPGSPSSYPKALDVTIARGYDITHIQPSKEPQQITSSQAVEVENK